MRLSVWLIEFIKLVGGKRLHPLNAECPICHRMVRLHYNKAGRRHMFAHARVLVGAVRRLSLLRTLYGEDEVYRVGDAGEIRTPPERNTTFQSTQVAWDGRLINAFLAITLPAVKSRP